MDNNVAFPDRYFLPSGRTISTFSTTPPLNTLIALPCAVNVEIEAVATLVKVAGSNDAVMRVGLYDVDYRTGLPGVSIELFPEVEVNASNQSISLPLNGKYIPADPYFIVVLFGGTTAPTMAACALDNADCQRLFGHGTLQSGIFSAALTNAVLCEYEYGELPFDWSDLSPTLGGSSLMLAVKASESATP